MQHQALRYVWFNCRYACLSVFLLMCVLWCMYLCLWFDWLYFFFFLQLTAASSVKYRWISSTQCRLILSVLVASYMWLCKGLTITRCLHFTTRCTTGCIVYAHFCTLQPKASICLLHACYSLLLSFADNQVMQSMHGVVIDVDVSSCQVADE